MCYTDRKDYKRRKEMSYLIYNRQRDMDEQYNSQHTHDDKIEIVQILSGSGRILVGNNFCVFRPGDVFIIDAGVIHCTSPDVPAEYTRNKLLFDRSPLVGLTGEKPFSLTSFFFLSDPKPLSDRFDRIAQLQKEGCSTLCISAEILLLLDLCLSHETERFISDDSISAKTISYIDCNLQSDLSLDALSAAMHISKFHLSRIFKSETGMTLGSYVQTTRLNHAKKRLLFSDDSIALISSQIRFNDPAAFSKAFTMRNGCSPIAYRKNGRSVKGPADKILDMEKGRDYVHKGAKGKGTCDI